MKTVAITLMLLFPITAVADIDLDNTVFDKAGARYQLDPMLIYAVALAESASGRGNGQLSPWPWTIRAPSAPFYGKTKKSAENKLVLLQQQHGQALDIGYMQINVKWNGSRVSSVNELLDPLTNVMVGTLILSESIQSAPNDIELGIGRYHQWKNETVARNYGRRVLAIYQNIKNLNK